jgi:uncharacterized protein
MKMLEEISFEGRPIMLAAWPGMGNVGLMAVDYMRRKGGGKVFAEIDMSPFFIPDSIIVKEGVAQLPEIPTSIFYYTRNPDVIFFESNAQIAGREGIAIIKTILDIAVQFKVSRILTSAAFAEPMSFQTTSKVLGAFNASSMMNVINSYGIIPMPDGYIAGLNGLMLGIAASRKIEAACLLGTIPSYATNLSYPKASLEIIKIVQKMLNHEIDLAEMLESITAMDAQLAAIEDRIREFFPSAEEIDENTEAPAEVEHENVPQYIMDKIEKLFLRAKGDRAAATNLKKELDRWKLFELYEDRFLDLFEGEDKEK